MISIRGMVESDVRSVVSFLKDEPVGFIKQWGGSRLYWPPVDETQILRRLNDPKSSDMFFAVLLNGAVIGSFELCHADFSERVCVLCRFIIKKELRSRGYGAEALRKTVSYAFGELNMLSVSLFVYDFNAAAIKCYEMAGFAEIERIKRSDGTTSLRMEIRNL